MDNLKDAYIKEKLEKDKLISKKADDVFNNFLNENVKIKKEHKKFNFKYPKLVAAVASVVIIFGAANVYASTQGYGNVFFMIKYLATGEKTTIDDKDELLSDRDITISYEPIKITENIEIQIARLQVKDKEAQLFINVNERELEEDKNTVPLKYKVYDSSKKKLCEQISLKAEKENEKNVTYTEKLKLSNYNKKDNTLKLEIYKANSDLITTITIDLNTKSITVSGEKEALNKISEIELKEFLGNVAGYTNKVQGFTEDECKIYLATGLLSLADKLETKAIETEINEGIKVDDINKMLDSFCGEKIENFKEEDFYKIVEENGIKYFVPKNGFDLSLTGECIDVTNMSYCGGLYTVTFTYCYLGEESIFDVDINDYNIYQNTVIIKLNENNEYSKFQLVSAEKPTIIKSSEEKEAGKLEETSLENNKNNDQTSDNTSTIEITNNEAKVDNYASTMSWTEYWAPGIKFKYPTIFTLQEDGGKLRGARKGELSTTITGLATGIDPDTKEIIKSNMKIEIYEPEDIICDSEEEYCTTVSKRYEGPDYSGTKFTTNSGLNWLRTSISSDNETKIIYTYYSELQWGYKIIITVDNSDNYKVINILNWLLGSTQITNY